ncbi:MAG: tetratricopeptide repeat protein [Gemmatimonadetes bacterium]|jgi:tetratricopeptide (TPR) repeat protein|nr:tetratricopeptide repeat protein [Gemmatimonadota bacterium]MBT7860294.1 tetratricopeptide repeat protein [Gemmatimonadota bacterium]
MTAARDTTRETQLAQALRRHEEAGDRKAMALDCYQLGAFYQDQGQINLAVHSIRRALVLCESLRDVQGVAMAYCRLGLLHEILGDFGQAEFLLQEARRRHDQIHDLRGLADDLGYIGFVNYQQGDLKTAESLYLEALSLHQQLRNAGKQAEDWGNLGNLYSTQGDADRARDAHHESLKLYEMAGDHQGMGNQYRSLARLAMGADQDEQAVELLDAAVAMHQKSQTSLGEGLDHETLGIVHERQKRTDLAEACYRRANELVETTGHKRHLASVRGRLGSLRLRANDADSALPLLQDAHDLSMQIDDEMAAARWGKRLADAQMKMGNLEGLQIRDLYEKSLRIYQKGQNPEGQAQVYVGLGNLAARQGESTQAVAMWTAATERFRQLGSESQVRQVEGAIQGIWVRGHREVA